MTVVHTEVSSLNEVRNSASALVTSLSSSSPGQERLMNFCNFSRGVTHSMPWKKKVALTPRRGSPPGVHAWDAGISAENLGTVGRSGRDNSTGTCSGSGG